MKVKCVESNLPCFIKGNIYEFGLNKISCETGTITSTCNSIEEWNDVNWDNGVFKLVKFDKVQEKQDCKLQGIETLEDKKLEDSITRIKKQIKDLKTKKDDIKKLKNVCKQVQDYLKYNYDPHTTAIITDNYIKLVRDEIGIPNDK